MAAHRTDTLADMLRHLLLAVVLIAPALAAAQGDPLAAARAAFVEALAGVPADAPAADDSEMLRGYPLYPYLQAERLQRRLDRAEADEDLEGAIGAFLGHYAGAPWTRALRAAWLKQLAERRRWPLFLAYYIEPRADTALRCDALTAMISTGADPRLQGPALAIWRTGSELPSSCVPVFEWLDAEGLLTPEEIAARTRLALEAGKPAVARMLIPRLPEDRRAPFQLWLEVLEDPRRNLERGIAQGVEPRAIFDGFSRLARGDSELGASLLATLEARCGTACALAAPATIGELRREVGLSQAWSRLPEAVETFRRVPESALDERGHEWRVRAALWSGEWLQAMNWIAAMPAPLAEQARWRYWRARSAEKLGRLESAVPGYERLAQENGYYAALAAERLGRAYAPRAQTRPVDPLAREQLAALPGLVRAREAWRIEQPDWARSEWSEATTGLDAAQLLEAARLASSWGWHLMAVATATRAEVFDDFNLLYPRPYEQELSGAARRAGLPANWVWGVLRQESLYDPRARSASDALGLLQLLPATARAVARRGGLDTPTRDALFDPSTNLLLGTAYLREQFETFGGRFALVLGAYNAGPNAVRRWLPAEPREADVWIENVPYNETRNYIQRIVWHSTVFGWKASGKPQRLTAWLTPISSDLSPVAAPGLASSGGG